MASEVAPPSSAVIRKAPKPPKPKVKMGRKPRPVVCDRCEQSFASAGERRAHECSNPPPVGRPRKKPPSVAVEAEPAALFAADQRKFADDRRKVSEEAESQSVTQNDGDRRKFAEPADFSAKSTDPPHSKGYSRIFVGPDGADLAVPITEETEVRRHAPAPAPVAPSVELAIPTDLQMKAMIDEYGELDRRRQLHASDDVRYETLKRAIKSWFDQAPPDADGTVEGEVYLLHLSARERERRVRDMRELLEVIGLDALLEVCTVALGLSRIASDGRGSTRWRSRRGRGVGGSRPFRSTRQPLRYRRVEQRGDTNEFCRFG